VRWGGLAAILLIAIGVIAIVLSDGSSEGDSDCVSSFPESLVSSGQATRSQLVPLQGLEGAIACRYRGLPGESEEEGEAGARAGSRTLDARSAVQLAKSLNGLRQSSEENFRNCPADLGGRLYISFRRPPRPAVLVLVELSGCRLISSPGVSAVSVLPPWLQAELKATTSD
jgi:hypothetical protein